jgi:hypothetical protein
MRESRTYGFVRGMLGDQHPYRDSQTVWFENSLPVGQRNSKPNNRALAQTRQSRAVSAEPPIGQISGWESAEQANVSVSVLDRTGDEASKKNSAELMLSAPSSL